MSQILRTFIPHFLVIHKPIGNFSDDVIGEAYHIDNIPTECIVTLNRPWYNCLTYRLYCFKTTKNYIATYVFIVAGMILMLHSAISLFV